MTKYAEIHIAHWPVMFAPSPDSVVSVVTAETETELTCDKYGDGHETFTIAKTSGDLMRVFEADAFDLLAYNTRKSGTLSWFDASAELKDGDRVRFDKPWDIFPEAIVPAGSLATVVENSLNEMQPVLLVLPDDPTLRDKVRQWDGKVWLYGPEGDAIDFMGEPIMGSPWQEPCAVQKVTP